MVSSRHNDQFLFHQTREFGFSWSESPSGGLSCVFHWGVASVWPLYHTGLIGGVLQRWLFFWKVLLSIQRNAGALSEWPSGSWSPPWLRPFSPDRSVWPGGPKSPGGSKLLPFMDDEDHCVHWDLQCCRNFSVPFPRSVPRYNPVSEVYRQFLGLHGLVCALTCTVHCGTLYRQVCAFPNHVQSTEFTSGGLQSRCRNIWRMISGNSMHCTSSFSFRTEDR